MKTIAKVLGDFYNSKIELSEEKDGYLHLRRAGVRICWAKTNLDGVKLFSVAVANEVLNNGELASYHGAEGVRVDVEWGGDVSHVVHISIFASNNRQPAQLEKMYQFGQAIRGLLTSFRTNLPKPPQSQNDKPVYPRTSLPRLIIDIELRQQDGYEEQAAIVAFHLMHDFGGVVYCRVPDWMSSKYPMWFQRPTSTPWPEPMPIPPDQADHFESVKYGDSDIRFAMYLYTGTGGLYLKFASTFMRSFLRSALKHHYENRVARDRLNVLDDMLMDVNPDSAIAYKWCFDFIQSLQQNMLIGDYGSAQKSASSAHRLTLEVTKSTAAADSVDSFVQILWEKCLSNMSRGASIVEATAAIYNLTILPDLHKALLIEAIKNTERLSLERHQSLADNHRATLVEHQSVPIGHDIIANAKREIDSLRDALQNRDELVSRQAHRIGVLEDRLALIADKEEKSSHLTEWFRDFQASDAEADVESESDGNISAIAQNLSDLVEYVRLTHEGKVLLTRPAIDSMRDSPYIYVDRAAKAFAILAGSMRDSFLGLRPIEEARRELRDAHMSLAWGHSQSAQKNPGWQRMYNGRKADMSMHICAGSSLDPRRCFRLHFEFDGDVVVVHHAGRHLDTGLI